MNIPENLKYTKDHEWIRLEGDCAVVGITEFAQSELGELVFVDLPAAGKAVKPHATLCVVESTKAASDVYAPLTGTVKEVNSALTDNPTLVNTNPYESGWMVKLENLNQDELAALLSPAQYREILAGRI
jgi:glycine cleavage system H protein